MVGRWKRSGVSPMSMALTLAPLRRRTPRTNRGISTILTGRFRGGFANVSAADTGLPSASAQRGSCGAARRPHPRSDPTGPARLLLGAWRLWSDVGSGPGLSEPPQLHEGRDPLAKGCVSCTKAPYLEYPHPSSSSTQASRIATRRRRTPPELLRAASPAPGGKARCGNRGRSISPLRDRRRNKTVLRRRAPQRNHDDHEVNPVEQVV